LAIGRVTFQWKDFEKQPLLISISQLRKKYIYIFIPGYFSGENSFNKRLVDSYWVKVTLLLLLLLLLLPLLPVPVPSSGAE